MPIQRPDIEAIFNAARQKPSEQRAAYLDQACGEDRALRQRIERLLGAQAEIGSFLDAPAPELDATRDLPVAEAAGTAIDDYKLLEQIGEGGFGVVYMAQQERPVSRKVALKVLKPGMDTRQVIARFEAERQALALMDHPNIARIHDGGTTATGRPYFVMELVRGVPVSDYCDQNHLPVRDRLELFVRVCEAVQHAHQKGIIHRDLKPSNVLVTLHDGTPVPKVIDFGVAKAIGQRLTDKTLFTAFAQIVGTPLYMSPEQAELTGLDVDTRSDVYSLGVVLYELLTGTTPFDGDRLRTAGYDELRRIIREEEPARPSSRVSTLDQAASTVTSGNRHTDARRLQRLLRGELDWVVMKCLEKDRTRRYETVDALAKDVQRYLADESVQACPPSPSYRLRKFARRHRRAFMTTVLLAAATITAAGSFGWTVRDRAARQAAIEHERNAVLDQAERFRAQGNWSEARASTMRARALLARDATNEQGARLLQIAKDLDMVARLEEIGLCQMIAEMAQLPNHIRAYEGEFRGYGMDVTMLDPRDAADRIRSSAIREPLLSAIDDWGWKLLAVEGLAQTALLTTKFSLSNPVDRARLPKDWMVSCSCTDLFALANLADDDERRKRIRVHFISARAQRGGSADERTRLRRATEDLADGFPTVSLPPATALLLARALSVSGAADRCLQVLSIVHQDYPADLWLNYELAYHLQLGPKPQRERAAGHLKVLLALRPKSFGAHVSLANCVAKAGDEEQAIALYRIALGLDQTNADVFRRFGLALTKRLYLQEAITAFDNAIELGNPCFAHRGRALAATGQWTLAVADYESELGTRSGAPLPEERNEHAALLVLVGDNEKYQRACARGLEIYSARPQSSGDVIVRGFDGPAARRAYEAARPCTFSEKAVPNLADPVRIAEEAVARYPQSANYLHTLGMAHFRAGHFDKAIQRLHDSNSRKPEWQANVLNWLGLALAYHRSEQPVEAQGWFDKAHQWIENAMQKRPPGAQGFIPGLETQDWLVCRILHREAAVMIRGKAE